IEKLSAILRLLLCPALRAEKQEKNHQAQRLCFHSSVLHGRVSITVPRSLGRSKRIAGATLVTSRPQSSNLFCPNPLLRSFFLLFCFRKLLGPQSKRLQHFVLALGPQHFHGLFHGPWRCKTLRPVRNPVSRQRHQRGVLRQHVWVHRFQRVGCRVMREFVLGRILIHV